MLRHVCLSIIIVGQVSAKSYLLFCFDDESKVYAKMQFCSCDLKAVNKSEHTQLKVNNLLLRGYEYLNNTAYSSLPEIARNNLETAGNKHTDTDTYTDYVITPAGYTNAEVKSSHDLFVGAHLTNIKVCKSM
jgi:hypothetical protein